MRTLEEITQEYMNLGAQASDIEVKRQDLKEKQDVFYMKMRALNAEAAYLHKNATKAVAATEEVPVVHS